MMLRSGVRAGERDRDLERCGRCLLDRELEGGASKAESVSVGEGERRDDRGRLSVAGSADCVRSGAGADVDGVEGKRARAGACWRSRDINEERSV